MTAIVECPSCGEPGITQWDTASDRETFRCPRCGDFAISGTDRRDAAERPLELRRDDAGTVWLTRPDRPGTVRIERVAEGSLSEPSTEVMEALTQLDAAIAKLGSDAVHIDLVTEQVAAFLERLRRLREQRDAEGS